MVSIRRCQRWRESSNLFTYTMKNPIVIRIPYLFPRIVIYVGSLKPLGRAILCHIFKHHAYVETKRYELDNGYATQQMCLYCLNEKYEMKHNREVMALSL